MESFGISLGGTVTAKHTHTGFGKSRHANLFAAVGALGQEHHRGRFNFVVFDNLHNFLITQAANRVAENHPAFGILDNFANDAALETATLAVTHAGYEMVLRGAVAVAELFPFLFMTIQVRDVVPHDFVFAFKAEHTAEAFVPTDKATMFVNFEAGRFQRI